jgi:hypothetical protein
VPLATDEGGGYTSIDIDKDGNYTVGQVSSTAGG